MSQLFEFLLLFLRQIGGGPGPPENNLVRFGLAAVLWGVLLYIAWSRQRSQELPREKLLVWGFGLGLARELYMFAQMSGRVIGVSEGGIARILHQPLEHALAMASVIVVAGAFLRYILDDARLSRRYLQVGLAVTVLCSVIGFWLWPRHLAAFPDAQFHETWGAWLFHAPLPVFIAIAIVYLGRKRLWLRNVVTVALMFFFLGEFLFLLNYTTNREYGHIICPTGNTFHILAIPILGYVYLREQSMEKAEVERALEAYRGHLEDLVDERTVELTAANTRLATQNAVAGTLSQSLDLDEILHTALDMVLGVLDLQVGSVFLLDHDGQRLVQGIHHGQVPMDELAAEGSTWYQISAKAAATMQGTVLPAIDAHGGRISDCDADAELGTLVSTPLVAQGRAVGALTLGARRTDAIQQSGLDLLTAIGQQIGMAIENARLYREAERWAEELTLLHQVSTFLTSTLDAQRIYNQMAEQSTKLLGCQVACVLLWGEERQEAKTISCYGMAESEYSILLNPSSLSSFLSDPAIDHGSIAIGDVRADPRVPLAWRETLDVRALLCLPVWSTDGPLGYLFLMDRRATRAWRSEELKLIESFVSRAAVALVNANLHKQLEWAAALEERQRIAASMHDGLAQTLSLLGLRIDQAYELLDAGADRGAAEELQRVRQVVDQASEDVRRSIASLQDTPRPRRSLQDLVADLSARFSAGGGPSVDLVIQVQEPLFLRPDHRAQALPVVQEALLNAQRHAQARRIALVLERRGDAVSITVEDDGRGFDVNESQDDRQGHFGLSIMRARAARIGGKLQIDSVPGQGTRACLTWVPRLDSGIARQDPVGSEATLEPVRLGEAEG